MYKSTKILLIFLDNLFNIILVASFSLKINFTQGRFDPYFQHNEAHVRVDIGTR